MSAPSKIAIFAAVIGTSMIAGWSAATYFNKTGPALTTYEACRYSAPDGTQSGCEPSTPANATKVTVRRRAG